MAVETLAINIWLKTVLSANNDLLALLGEPFNTATVIKRKTIYQISDALYVPFPSNGKTYKVAIAGKTSSIAPAFPGMMDEVIIDGTVTWLEFGDVGIRARIFEGVAPAEAKEPFIVFNLQNPETAKRIGMGSTDLFGSYDFQVRATDRGNDKTLTAKIADEIDETLNIGENNAGGIVSFNSKDYMILGAYRDLPIDIQEVVEETRYNHIGGMYKILVQAQ